MKTITVILFCFIGIHAEAPTNLNNGDDDMITCLIENRLDPGIYNHRKLDTNLPTEDQKNCYLACMFKKIGYMKKDGTLNFDVILSNAFAPEKRAEGKRKLDEIVNTCKLQAANDVCKLARCFQDLRKSPKSK